MSDATHRPYRQDATQREREEVLRNDQRANTFAGRAISEADDVRGRWAEINKSNVVGATPTVDYPRLPSGPWADPVQVPPEPSLGFSVEDHEPVGTIQEIEASLGEQSASLLAQGDAVVVSASSAAAVAPSESFLASPHDVERAAAIPNPKHRRRE
jgi:hypothetical protein